MYFQLMIANDTNYYYLYFIVVKNREAHDTGTVSNVSRLVMQFRQHDCKTRETAFDCYNAKRNITSEHGASLEKMLFDTEESSI